MIKRVLCWLGFHLGLTEIIINPCLDGHSIAHIWYCRDCARDVATTWESS